MEFKELCRRVADKTGEDENRVKLIFGNAIEAICEEVAEGGTVSLQNFGKFAIKRRLARRVTSFLTHGIPKEIPARNDVKFTASKIFKNRLN